MKHILVIDDDAAIRDLLEYLLTRHGYRVTLAENGVQGEEQVAMEKPDLVITDMMMPEEDGMELLMHMRKQRPTLPIIAISGGMRDYAYNPLPVAQKLGASFTFLKPLDVNEVLRAVQTILEPI